MALLEWPSPLKYILVAISLFLLIRLDAAIAATEGKVNLALVDIDNLSDLALDYDVQAVPTVLAVKDGKVRLMEYK